MGKYLLTVTFMVVGISLLGAGAFAQNTELADKPFSVKADKEEFQSVAARVGKELNTILEVDSNLAQIRISGNYRNVTLDEFLNRALKGENVVVEFGKDGNSVLVKSFAAVTTGKIHSKSNMDLSLTETPKTGIEEKQASQLASFEEWSNDPEAKDPMTGMRRGDLLELQQEQLDSFEKWRNNPNAKEPMTGLSRQALQDKQTEQLASFESRQKMNEEPPTLALEAGGDDAGEISGNVTKGQLASKKDKQLSTFEKWKNNPDSIEPMTGLRRGDLAELQRKQMSEFESRTSSN